MGIWDGDRGWQKINDYDIESKYGKKLFELKNRMSFDDFNTEDDFLKMKKNARNLERAMKNSKMVSPLKRLANKEALMKIGAPLGKATGLGGQAAGYLKTAAPAIPRALGFMANPLLAAMAGMFAPTQMGSSEFIGSPEHQQWLARRGPLAKR